MTSISSNTKIALVTGANKGIGLAIAKSLSSSTHSYHVLLCSRDPALGQAEASALQAQGHSVEAVTLDVSQDSRIITAAQDVASKFGRLDVLINNAGISHDSNSDLTLRERYEKSYAVNVFGSAVVTETFLPLLAKSAAPRIVFISSNLGSLTLKANFESGISRIPVPIYRTSKAALNMLMLHYAKTYENEKKWKINACHPGFASTDLTGGRGGSVERAAVNAVRLATLGEEGETGKFSEAEGVLPW
jgi:NAD(P)-dependent dehydrogenase (short-subunit alcohol dehydrogenase family)